MIQHHDQRGIIGLAFLGVIVLAMAFAAAYYVYEARSGRAITVEQVLHRQVANPGSKQ